VLCARRVARHAAAAALRCSAAREGDSIWRARVASVAPPATARRSKMPRYSAAHVVAVLHRRSRNVVQKVRQLSEVECLAVNNRVSIAGVTSVAAVVPFNQQ